MAQRLDEAVRPDLGRPDDRVTLPHRGVLPLPELDDVQHQEVHQPSKAVHRDDHEQQGNGATDLLVLHATVRLVHIPDQLEPPVAGGRERQERHQKCHAHLPDD